MKQGFSLIELLLVIAIILSVSILSMGFYARFITQNGVFVAMDQTVSQLRKAQLYSEIGKQDSSWGVHYANKILTLFAGNSYVSRNPAFDESFTFTGDISVTGWNDVVFIAPVGTPSATLNTTISGQGSSQSVVVNAQGTVNRQ